MYFIFIITCFLFHGWSLGFFNGLLFLVDLNMLIESEWFCCSWSIRRCPKAIISYWCYWWKWIHYKCWKNNGWYLIYPSRQVYFRYIEVYVPTNHISSPSNKNRIPHWPTCCYNIYYLSLVENVLSFNLSVVYDYSLLIDRCRWRWTYFNIKTYWSFVWLYPELPLEPSLSRTLIEANEYDCLSQALTVAAMLSAETTLLLSRRLIHPEYFYELRLS